jgi:hypothetical protein
MNKLNRTIKLNFNHNINNSHYSDGGYLHGQGYNAHSELNTEKVIFDFNNSINRLNGLFTGGNNHNNDHENVNHNNNNNSKGGDNDTD